MCNLYKINLKNKSESSDFDYTRVQICSICIFYFHDMHALDVKRPE